MKKNVIGAAEKTEKSRDALEDSGGKKMNVGEEMLTKNRVSMQSGEEEDAKQRRMRMKRRERSEERRRSVTKPSEKRRKCGETIEVAGIAGKMES